MTKTQGVVAGRRNPESDQPAGDVGGQRRHPGEADEHDDHREVYRGGAADNDEPAGAPARGKLSVDLGRCHAPPPTRPPRSIAVCVDDFGLHAGINAAAVQLARLGRVNAISCLVGGPAWSAGSSLLSQLDAQAIDIGLHLDLTEFPLMTGSRRGLPWLIASAYCRRLAPQQLRNEICAQLDAFEDAMGRAPAFVDGHQHVHQLPLVRDALLAVLGLRGPARPWLRGTRQPCVACVTWPEPPAQRRKARLIEALGAQALGRLARERGHAQNRHLLGVRDFGAGGPGYGQLVRGWLARAGDGDLLMCHPSLRVAVRDPILAARAVEYEFLCAPAFATALAEAGIGLWPMGRMLALA